ncbi:hypothetical protein WA026_018856 [Henosepilachna vigintioctopunctata]|uniref:LAGLIDADG homing endonuclease n=1 Tax=Henosepilachna vigintioctopunctata TaxID=420089 RepID=A0AAW1UNB1_9CUCU
MYRYSILPRKTIFPFTLCHSHEAKKMKCNPVLVWAEWLDKTFQPASIVGKSKRAPKCVSVLFYHNGRCKDVSPVHIIYNHGNLLDACVTVKYNGSCHIAKVYGNNSPKFKGFPTRFYVRLERTKSFVHIPLRRVFLNNDQAKMMLLEKRNNSNI